MTPETLVIYHNENTGQVIGVIHYLKTTPLVPQLNSKMGFRDAVDKDKYYVFRVKDVLMEIAQDESETIHVLLEYISGRLGQYQELLLQHYKEAYKDWRNNES